MDTCHCANDSISARPGRWLWATTLGFATLGFVALGVRPLHAQELRAHRLQTESPYFYVKSDDPTVDRLPLKGTEVNVHISGVIADVTVTQHYRNEGQRPIEAKYVFPGSTKAAVNGLSVRLADRLVTAQIREKQQAQIEYDTAKKEGKTAAPLERHLPDVFQMNVANILPGDDIQVELHYTELLVPQSGNYQFVFPTVVGPRYNSPQSSQAGASWHADITLAKSAEPADNRDFVLDYRLAGDKIESGLMLFKGQSGQGSASDENFFLAMVEPPQSIAATAITPRDYIFVLDIFGSMHGFPLDTAKVVLRELIGGLRSSARLSSWCARTCRKPTCSPSALGLRSTAV